MTTGNRQLILVSLISLAIGISAFMLLRSQSADFISASSVDQTNEEIDFKKIPFTLLDQKQTSLNQWQQPVLIINFWAPWCLPCRKEIPDLIEIKNEYPDQLQILGLSFDREDFVREYQQKYNINYPLLLTQGKEAFYNRIFGNQSGGLPYTVILDQKRQIRFQHTGIISKTQLKTELENIISYRP